MDIVTSSPGKVILFGEHGVNRQQPAIAAAVDLRLLCHISVREDGMYRFCSKTREETYDLKDLRTFKREVDLLRESNAFDEIRERARDFFAPTRYVLAYVLERAQCPGLDVEWRSSLPLGAGLGSGAAASTSMALAVMKSSGYHPKPDELAFLAWQGDYIAHGGVASSLDSSTCAYGRLIHYTVADGAKPFPFDISLPLVIGDTRVQKNTAAVNTHVRTWLDAHPERMHLFRDMGFLAREAGKALEARDFPTLGRFINLNQLILEKLGTSCPEIDNLIEASMGAGALGAKISGSGGGGVIIALTEPGRQAEVAKAIERVGGLGIITEAGAEGTRVESTMTWEKYLTYDV
ncbi:mevalonate kinase [[Eubacterium] cellulosolvens]